MNYETQRYRHRRRQKVAKRTGDDKYLGLRKWRYTVPAGLLGWAIVVSIGVAIGHDLYAGVPGEVTFNNAARLFGLIAFAAPVLWTRDERWTRIIVVAAGVPILWIAQPVFAARIICMIFGDCG